MDLTLKQDTNETTKRIKAGQGAHRQQHWMLCCRIEVCTDSGLPESPGCQTNFSLGHGLDPGRNTDAMFGPDHTDGPGSAQYSEAILSFL